jgi:hypothetical protein
MRKEAAGVKRMIGLLLLGLTLWATPLFAQTLAPDEEREGFMPLFNGKDLDGWEIIGDAEAWQVKDGVIVLHGQRGRVAEEPLGV